MYKPIYEEAQAAVALILYLRAGIIPPATLVNARTYDPVTRSQVPSVLLKPVWVTARTMAATVIRDRLRAGGAAVRAARCGPPAAGPGSGVTG